MSTFKFNRLYIIESLQERLTGKELYDDLINGKNTNIANYKLIIFRWKIKQNYLLYLIE